MCQSIHHRGPDHTDYFLDNGVGLGIDRLKIIDLVTGGQPIHNEDGSVWIVFNGEIYDYQRLRQELESLGHRFYTESDTECIVHAYEVWGAECVGHLRGMFAFAIWDSRKKVLYLARDRFGKKPLYYAQLDGVLLFGSELKTILQYDNFERKLSYTALDLYFTYGYVPSPYSILEGIFKIPPGHYGILREGKLSVVKYWDYTFSHDNFNLSEDEVIEVLYKEIEQAVKIRMRSDVPLGAFLSGGIDSSVVVSLMTKLSETPVKTVSIGFNDDLSEVRYSREMANFLHTDHREYEVTPDAYNILPKLIWHFDEPFADNSMIPTYYLSQVTRGQVTVALSGDGGDEIFMGYPFLKDPPVLTTYSRIPGPLRKPALVAINRLGGGAAQIIDGGPRTATKTFLERYADRMSVNRSDKLQDIYSSDLLSKHRPENTVSYLEKFSKFAHSADRLDVLDYVTIRTYLEEDILVKVDRMSMAVSLEARCPLLDQEVANLVASIPSSMKWNGDVMKYIFKKMAVKKGLVPPEIAYRKKHGFTAPVRSWVQKEWKEVTNQLLDPFAMKDYGRVLNAEMLKTVLSDPRRNSGKIFAIIVFMLWYKMYLESDYRLEAEEPKANLEKIIQR